MIAASDTNDYSSRLSIIDTSTATWTGVTCVAIGWYFKTGSSSRNESKASQP